MMPEAGSIGNQLVVDVSQGLGLGVGARQAAIKLQHSGPFVEAGAAHHERPPISDRVRAAMCRSKSAASPPTPQLRQ